MKLFLISFAILFSFGHGSPLEAVSSWLEGILGENESPKFDLSGLEDVVRVRRQTNHM